MSVRSHGFAGHGVVEIYTSDLRKFVTPLKRFPPTQAHLELPLQRFYLTIKPRDSTGHFWIDVQIAAWPVTADVNVCRVRFGIDYQQVHLLAKHMDWLLDGRTSELTISGD